MIITKNGCSSNSIINNTVKGVYYGIQIGQTGTTQDIHQDNIIVNNTVVYTYYGIFLATYTENSTVYKNNITDTKYGVFMRDTSENFLGNNIIEDYDNEAIYPMTAVSNTTYSLNYYDNQYHPQEGIEGLK